MLYYYIVPNVYFVDIKTYRAHQNFGFFGATQNQITVNILNLHQMFLLEYYIHDEIFKIF